MEIWKPAFGYVGLYEVSSMGNVKSFYTGKILKARINRNGYCIVGLSKNKISTTKTVHRLVANSFFGADYSLKVDHINNIRTDNRLINLQLIPQRLNSSKDRKNKSSKFTGVSFHQKTKKWLASIWMNGKNNTLGFFTNEIDASKAYQETLTKLT